MTETVMDPIIKVGSQKYILWLEMHKKCLNKKNKQHYSIGESVRQDCSLSSFLFNVYGEYIILKTLQSQR